MEKKKGKSLSSLTQNLKKIGAQIALSIGNCQTELKKSLEDITKLIPSDLWPDLVVTSEFVAVNDTPYGINPCATDIKLVKGIIVKNIRDHCILLTPEGLLDVPATKAFSAIGAGSRCTIKKFESKQMQTLFNSQYGKNGCSLPLLKEGKDYGASIDTVRDHLPAVIEAVAKLFTSYQS